MIISYGKAENLLLCPLPDFLLKEGEQVVVKSPRGEELGIVMEIKEEEEKGEEKPEGEILRLVTPEDLSRWEELEKKAKETMPICEEEIEKHNLPMKLIDAEYTLDGKRLIFYFSAQERIDFRALLKSLAKRLKIRIELTQIGARDEAKRFGGLGVCGRVICCASFLTSFRSITLKMLKEQNLLANPNKFTGACGRLMCCLYYEYDYYHKMRELLPKPGATVMTPEGKGKVVDVDVLRERIAVEVEEKGTLTFSGKEIHFC